MKRRRKQIHCDLINELKTRFDKFTKNSCSENNAKCIIKHDDILLDHHIHDPEKYKEQYFRNKENMKVVDCFIFINATSHYLYIVELKSGKFSLEIQDKFDGSLNILQHMDLRCNKIKIKLLLIYQKMNSIRLKQIVNVLKKQRIQYNNEKYKIIIKRSGFEIDGSEIRNFHT